MPIEVGVVLEKDHRVETEDTAQFAGGKAFPPVFSTPTLVGMLEDLSHEAIAPFLREGQSSVGTMVCMRHLAATPVGMTVRLRVEVTEVVKRRIQFSIEAWDDVEQITSGTHERYIIDNDRFEQKFKEKCAKVNCGD